MTSYNLLKDGAMAGFKYFAFDGDESQISATLADNAQGVLEVYIDLGRKEAATLELRTDGKKVTVSAALACEAGVKPLYFIYEGNGSLDFHDFTIS